MSGIYLHIPFCKKRCHYCDFYSTTQVRLIPPLIEALKTELILRKEYLPDEPIETVYFGGGTPSLLSAENFIDILDVMRQNFDLSLHAEITIEANPDDLTEDYLRKLSQTPVNRISVGIQSFDDEQLKTMNRRHNANQAKAAVLNCKKQGFSNLSIDLIYGLPGMDADAWKRQLKQALELDVPHISAYHLTYEKGTVFATLLSKNKLSEIPEDISLQQFEILIDWAKQNGYEHYEISNFAQKGKYSKHNTSYWQQKPYLGIGPAAHSFDLKTRSWNVANLKEYLTGIEKKEPVLETELLSETDRFNDYIITSLRTIWGIDLGYLSHQFKPEYVNELLKKYYALHEKKYLVLENNSIKLTGNGIFISDRIITDLMQINDE